MLVFTRRPGEGIVIGGNVTVRLVRMGNGKIRLGISAPKTVTVDREEVDKAKVEDRRRETADTIEQLQREVEFFRHPATELNPERT